MENQYEYHQRRSIRVFALDIQDEIDICPCPVEKCMNKSKQYDWTHDNCGGHEKITKEGKIRCLKCDEIDFICPCPVDKCINKSKQYHWTHHNCGGHEKITKEGKIRCLKCEDHDFEYSSFLGMCYALSVMSQLNVGNEGQAFIGTLIKKVGEQYNEASKFASNEFD